MVLSQPDIKKAVASGEIVFDPPLDEKQWGPVSVNLRLGLQFTKLRNQKGIKISIADGLGNLPAAGFWETADLKERNQFGKQETYPLAPGEFVLAMTHEKITIPNNLVAIVEGRSTYARVGLSMHQTAPWIQPGWAGKIVLEIMNNGPLTIELTPLLDKPCQLTFFQLSTPLDSQLVYGAGGSGKYQNQKHPLKP